MAREDLKRRIDRVEEAYEFMLSYAARGLADDQSTSLRRFLEHTHEALDGIGDAVRAVLAEDGDEDAAAKRGVERFVAVLERDAAASQAAVGMVLAQPAIGSQLIDNLNASIHVRALLTDLFLIDEALELGVGAESPPAAFAPNEGESFGPPEEGSGD
jgi:hypothetical protein